MAQRRVRFADYEPKSRVEATDGAHTANAASRPRRVPAINQPPEKVRVVLTQLCARKSDDCVPAPNREDDLAMPLFIASRTFENALQDVNGRLQSALEWVNKSGPLKTFC